MHQALYRKWRPRTFDDVCGQEHVTSVLRHEVAEGAPNHAYLFCGSRGTGKTTCAKILAKAVNCEHPANGNPCGVCAACRAIENGSATDVLEMDAASNNGVDNIRDIRDEVVYTPSSLTYRVYIVDEVHMLSQSAFNALLKTLEEPPAHVIFILATTELQKLPATIVSRCQRFDFRRIATPVMAARLAYIAKEEGIDLLPEAADRIARMAQGGMRDAISLLELCAGTRRTVDVATVNEMMGSGGREDMLALVAAVADADYDRVFAAVDEAVNAARDLTVFWQDLLSVYRDLLVVKTTSNAARYLDLTDAETAALAAVADRFDKGRLLAHCHLIEEAFFAMQKANAVRRMVAELTLLRMCDPALDTSAEGLLARIERLEDGFATGALAAEKPKVKPLAKAAEIKPQKSEEKSEAPAKAAEARAEKAPIPTPTAGQGDEKPTPPAGGRVLHRLRGFANCAERIGRDNPMLGAWLVDVRAYLTEEGRPLLQMPNEFALQMVEGNDGRRLLARAIGAELQREVPEKDLIFEVSSGKDGQKDVLLDDLIEAAGDQTDHS